MESAEPQEQQGQHDADAQTETETGKMVDLDSVNLQGLLSQDHDPMMSGEEGKNTGRGQRAGVRGCPVYCTWFSLVGAVFLFVLGDVLRNDYEYILIEDRKKAGTQVIITGVIYLGLAFICGGVWMRDAFRARRINKQLEEARQSRLHELSAGMVDY